MHVFDLVRRKTGVTTQLLYDVIVSDRMTGKNSITVIPMQNFVSCLILFTLNQFLFASFLEIINNTRQKKCFADLF